MSKWKKIAAVAAPAIMALAAAPADAKVLLMGDGGWEVSFDGSVNGFYSYTSVDKTPKQKAGHAKQNSSVANTLLGANDYSNITTGLLPAVWGMNVKAPTTNGLDMSARLGLYPNIQNGTTKNKFGAQLDLREIFFQVDGSFGSVLVGRTLSLYQGKNILTDMTLFGVGAPNNGGGGTTLGRIGYGYVYPQFNAAIRFTTPDMNGVKLSAGIYQPSKLAGENFATDIHESPRFEGELSYAGDLGGASLSLWGSGMYQKAERAAIAKKDAKGANINLVNAIPAGAIAANVAIPVVMNAAEAAVAGSSKIDSKTWGTAGGMQVGFAGLTLTASGYYGQGLGTTLMLDTDGFDAKGKGRKGVGYLAQGTYGFGQGTSIGVSYGMNRQFNTNEDKVTDGDPKTDGVQRQNNVVEQNLLDVMMWHDINKNLRVVGEWSKAKIKWNDGTDRDGNTFSVGGFFFW